METKVQQMEVDASSVKNMQAIEGSEPGTLPIVSPTNTSDEQLQEIGRKISHFKGATTSLLG